MFLVIWLVLLLVVAAFVALPLTFWRREILARYSGSRLVSCPENQQQAVVSIDARQAALTEMDGRPNPRLCECSRWPERSACDQACLSAALQTEPYPPGRVKRRVKQIYHLPVLFAAFAAWYVGAIWHSQYLFRPRWIAAVGLTPAQVKQIVWWLSPHLLTFGMWLLFAYGVASLLALWHRKGVLSGVLISVLMLVALAAASGYAIAGLPHNLLVMEGSYILLATFIVGAIVGGLYDKVRVRA
jgi:hypothetical protein